MPNTKFFDQENTIIRTQKSANFTQVSNKLLEDNSISWEAKGVMCYLLSKPDNWQVRVADLRNHATNGRDQTYKILRELCYAGYMKRQRRRIPGYNLIRGYEYIVYESKLTLSPSDIEDLDKQFNRTSRFPGFQYTENQEHSNTDSISNKLDIHSNNNIPPNPQGGKTAIAVSASDSYLSIKKSKEKAKKTAKRKVTLRESVKNAQKSPTTKKSSSAISSYRAAAKRVKTVKKTGMEAAKSREPNCNKYATGELKAYGDVYENIFLFEGEYAYYVEKYGKLVVDNVISQMESYLVNNPKGEDRYKDHFAAMRSWLANREEKAINTKQFKDSKDGLRKPSGEESFSKFNKQVLRFDND